MSEKFPSKEDAYKMAYEDKEKIDSVQNEIASQLHEDWRKTRLNEDGTYEPRFKKTSDEEWISSHNGSTEVDIANTAYEDLPTDWQAENAAAGSVVATELIIAQRNQGEINQTEVERISAKVHDEWLKRNDWAAIHIVTGKQIGRAHV